jgi:pimeloyl-ACP methyl ester carboxylesterase
VAVFVHGYLAGDFEFNERVWPLSRFDELGFDTVLFTLPFHGRRAPLELKRNPPFPGRDPMVTIEGFRQAVADLRGLIQWLRGRGASHVGLIGMSLGGYTAALTATVETELSFLVPVVPLACLADFAREQGNLPDGELGRRYEAALRKAYAAVSPLERPPRIESGRTLVVGAQADRITQVGHARRIAHHFSAPLHTWPGGHLLQWGRGEAFDRVEDFLRRLDLVRKV